MSNEDDFDEVLEYELQILTNQVDALYDYFFNPKRDMSKFAEMLALYNKKFENFDEYVLGIKFRGKDLSQLVTKFKAVGEKLAHILTEQQNGEEIGHKLVQSVIDSKQKLNKNPALLQYLFLKLSQRHTIPFKPLSAFSDYRNAAMALLDNSICIRCNLGDKEKEICLCNAYALYVLEHELQHISQRLSNPNGTNEERLLHLYSEVQPLEDGFENGKPSHNIAQHIEFPDEIKADYDACAEIYQFIAKEFSLPDDELKMVKEFLKRQQIKLVSQNVQSQTPLSPEEYLEFFVEKHLKNNKKLSKTEQERVQKFIQTYEEITNKNFQL